VVDLIVSYEAGNMPPKWKQSGRVGSWPATRLDREA